MARIVLILIGLLLSITALLKLWMLISDPFADVHSGYPWVMIATAVYVEFGLLVWLLFGQTSETKLTVCFWFFCVMSCIATARILMGFKSCGCFGKFQVSQEWMLAVDLIIMAVVWISISYSTPPRKIQNVLFSSDVAVPTLGFLIPVLIAISVYSTNAQIPGLSLSKRPAILVSEAVQFGEASIDNPQVIHARIWNRSTRPIEILRVMPSCHCLNAHVKAGDRLAPGWNDIEIEITPLGSGRFFQRLLLWIGNEQQQVVVIDLSGQFL